MLTMGACAMTNKIFWWQNLQFQIFIVVAFPKKNSVFVRAGFRQNGFFADFYFWAAGFFRGFSRRIFSPHFCGKKCPEKSSRKIPGKILQNLYNKNPSNTFLQIAQGNFWTIVLSAPLVPPLKEHKFCFYCRLAVNETTCGRCRP